MLGPAASKAVTEDGAVTTGPGQLVSVVITAAAATSTIVLYDNASAATGTVICSLSAVANTSASWSPSLPVVYSKGIYADIGGASAAAYVAYV